MVLFVERVKWIKCDYFNIIFISTYGSKQDPVDEETPRQEAKAKQASPQLV